MNNKLFKLFIPALLVIVMNFSLSHAQQKAIRTVLAGKVAADYGTEIRITNSPISLGDDWHYENDPNEIVLKNDKNGNFLVELIVEKSDFYRVSTKGKTIELYICAKDKR